MASASACSTTDSEEDGITPNLDYLTSNLTNLSKILICLIEKKIVSENESDEIKQEVTPLEKNWKLLTTVKRKSPGNKRSFLEIFNKTGNKHCADKMKEFCPKPKVKKINQLLQSKWWPEEIYLPNAFCERKMGDISLIEKLKNILTSNTNRRTVINQKVSVSGLGGIGKSTTAKWFSIIYQDNYDHIIWIDCGEGSLEKSFKRLARDLDLKYRNEMELNELATKCFAILKAHRCLFIYDNAESYVGKDGIKDVLPETNESFHIIITSRNRDWGKENVGGKIQELPLDVFGTDEAIQFVKENINVCSNSSFCDETNFETLCELLGNLPLALQIAIATVNQKALPLSEYIQRIKATDYIIAEHGLDDYEKSISKTMTISLDVINTNKNPMGELAYKILISFGYVTPSDVPVEFFQSVENKKKFQMNEATELLEKYSLLTINKANDTVSIHRLLQQVIRHKEKKQQNEIIETILKCEGFLEYKLIPYCFADKELQDTFLQIKFELIDKLELQKLIIQRKFQEAVNLSRLIRDQIPSPTSIYNYGFCLRLNNDIEEALTLFETLFQQVSRLSVFRKEGNDLLEHIGEIGLLSSAETVDDKRVAGQLLLIYLQNDFENEKVIQLMNKSMAFAELTNCSLKNFTKGILSIPEVRFTFNGSSNFTYVLVNKEKLGKSLILSDCHVDEELLCHNDLHTLVLEDVTTTPTLFQFISSSQIRKLVVQKIPIDMSSEYSADEVLLQSVTVADWEKAKWNVKLLVLQGVNFIEKNQMKINEFRSDGASVDFSVLPFTLEKLFLNNTTVINSLIPHDVIVDIQVPVQLQELKLIDVTFQNVSPQIISLPSSIKMLMLSRCYVNLSSIPEKISVLWAYLSSIETIHLEGCNVIVTSAVQNSPKELTLINVGILNKLNSTNNMNKDLLFNEFVDFRKMKKLMLKKILIAIDLSDETISVDEVSLDGGVEVFNWRNSKWTISQLTLNEQIFQKNEMNIQELKMDGPKQMQTKGEFVSNINLFNSFPNSLGKLNLNNMAILGCTRKLISEVQLPNNLQELSLTNVGFETKTSKGEQCFVKMDISPLILPTLQKVQLNSHSIIVSLNKLISIPSIHLTHCKLIHESSEFRIRPKELFLRKVVILNKKLKKKTNILLNDFIDFRQMRKLCLANNSYPLDASKPFSIEELDLGDTEVLNWNSFKWEINKLTLNNSQMNFKLVSSSLPLSVKSVSYIIKENNQLEKDEESETDDSVNEIETECESNEEIWV